MGALLGSRAPGSMRDVALHRGGPSFMAWGALEHVVRTATPAFEAAARRELLQLSAHAPRGRRRLRRDDDAPLPGGHRGGDRALRLRRASRVLDVGGGRGHFVRAVLNAHPWLDGAVFDVPEVAEVTAREPLRRTGSRRSLRRDRRQLLRRAARRLRPARPQVDPPRLERRLVPDAPRGMPRGAAGPADACSSSSSSCPSPIPTGGGCTPPSRWT